MKKLLTLGLTVIFSMSVFANTIYFLPENKKEAQVKISFSRTRSSVNRNLPGRLNALLNELSSTDKKIKGKFDQILKHLFKNWYLMSEFEKDQQIVLQLDRDTLDLMSNLSDRLQALEVELFNPEALGFNKIYSNLDAAKKAMETSYNALMNGKRGLKQAKDAYSQAKDKYTAVTDLIAKVIKQVSQAVPYTPPQPQPQPHPQPQPQPNPQPTINYNKIVVNIERKKIRVKDYNTVDANSYEGKLVIKKSKEKWHELGTLDRIMFKSALKGKDGFSYVIVKHKKYHYTIYWWHLADDIADIVNQISDIVNGD